MQPLLIKAQEVLHPIDEMIRLGQLRFEKCEFLESRSLFNEAANLAIQAGKWSSYAEALAGLIRIASEAQDSAEFSRIVQELRQVQAQNGNQPLPPQYYFAEATYWNSHDKRKVFAALRQFFAALRRTPGYSKVSVERIKGFLLILNAWTLQKKYKRAQLLASNLKEIIERNPHLHKHLGLLQISQAVIFENQGSFKESLKWFEAAHASLLEYHHWYHHLYVLLGYARLARHMKQFAKSSWYLDLIEKTSNGPHFTTLKILIQNERAKLNQEVVDLTVDLSQGIVRTKDGVEIKMRKQFLLVDILVALSQNEQGLTKGALIERVWKEPYRPEAHDNKLYFNINRLRRLIEPDVHHPRYLLSTRDGYRFAPHLKVQVVKKPDVLQHLPVAQTSSQNTITQNIIARPAPLSRSHEKALKKTYSNSENIEKVPEKGESL